MKQEIPIRVLLADDHQVMRRAIRKLLSQKVDILVVGESATGREALSMTEQLQPDVLVLDMDMPEMDGVEVARQLRKKKSSVHVLVLSAYDDRSYIRLVLEQGVCGYLTKEEAPGKVVDAIRKVAQGGWVGAPATGGFSGLSA